MPFDPAKPADNFPLDSQVMCVQLNENINGVSLRICLIFSEAISSLSPA